MRRTPHFRLPTTDSRRLGLRVLLVSTFFAWGGFFMVAPMISIHDVDGLGWTAGAVGLVLAARQFFQQGFTPCSGVLADRFGANPLIALGMIVRAVGFGAMRFAGTYPLLMASAIVAAVGSALLLGIDFRLVALGGAVTYIPCF